MRKEFSSEEFLKIKRQSIANEPQVHSTILSNIIIEPESFDKKYIILILPDKSKHQLTVSNDFFKELSKILKINMSLRQRMSGDNKHNEMYSTFLNALKMVQEGIAPIDITLLYDVVEKQITHIKQGSYSRLSNESLFNFVEGLIDKYPSLSVIDVFGGQNTSNAEIKLLSGSVVDLTNKAISDEDESFQFGLTMGNSGLSTSVGDFAYRLVCANGMMGIRTDERFHLKDTTEKGLRELFTHFETLKEHNFVPEDFAGNFEKATQVHASFAELDKAYKFAQKNIMSEFPDQLDQLRSAFGDKYFSDIRIVEAMLKAKNIDKSELDPKALQHIRTKTTMWDLVNTMTDLGSNEHQVFKVQNKRGFQKYGGKLMSEPFDFEYEKFLLL
jgi:hypothetical protein